MDSRLLNAEKGNLSFIERLSKESFVLFRELEIDSSIFECNVFITKLIEFLDKYNRIQYASLSSLIYGSDDENRFNINSNLEELVNYAQTQDFDELFSDGDAKKREVISKTLIKLWDHYNLAITQMRDLNIDDFYDKFWPEKDNINETIKDEGRKIHKELISMVAIFTAMSFLIFGGLDSLSNVLSSSIAGLPILNISVVCFAWALCVYNLIYLFMYLVGKLVDQSIVSRRSNKFYKRHAVFLIGNSILVVGLLLTGWLYFIQTDFNGWYTSLYRVLGGYAKFMPIFIALTVLLFVLVVLIFKKIKKAVTKCYYVHKYNMPVIIEDDAVYDNEWNLLQRR